MNYYNYDHYNIVLVAYYLADYLAYRLLKDNLTEKTWG